MAHLNNEQNFKCEFCGLEFETKSLMTLHKIRTHFDEIEIALTGSNQLTAPIEQPACLLPALLTPANQKYKEGQHTIAACQILIKHPGY